MVVRGPDVVWRAAEGLLVLGRPGGAVITVGGAGADVWRRIATDVAFDHLVADLAASFGAPADVIGRDVEAMLAEMRPLGFVVDG